MKEILTKQFTDAFNRLAQEGIAAFDGDKPVLSHVCFKFKTMQAYQDYVAAAREIGVVSQEEFNGKEITWCHLHEPLEKDGLMLEWLEMVEPRKEPHITNGVSSIGYCVPSLEKPVKIPSQDSGVIFRYQSQHAASLANQ